MSSMAGTHHTTWDLCWWFVELSRARDLFLLVPNLAGAILGVEDFQLIRRRVRKLVVMLPSLLGVHNGLVVLHHRQPAGSNPGVLELHAHKAFFLFTSVTFPMRTSTFTFISNLPAYDGQ